MFNLQEIIDRGSPDAPGEADFDAVPSGLCIFTPDVDTAHRVRLYITPEDSAKIPRGKGWSATVTDVPTGLEFDVESAPCGAGCHCAARITAIRFP